MTEVCVSLNTFTVNLNAKISCNSTCEPFVFHYIFLYFKLTTNSHTLDSQFVWMACGRRYMYSNSKKQETYITSNKSKHLWPLHIFALTCMSFVEMNTVLYIVSFSVRTCLRFGNDC